MSDKREKRLLAERNKPKTILGFKQFSDEDHEKYVEEMTGKDDGKSWWESLTESVEPITSGVKKAASKVGDFFRESYHEATTPRYTKDRKKVIEKKMKGENK